MHLRSIVVSGGFASAALLAGLLAACSNASSGAPAGNGPGDSGGQEQEVDATSDTGGGSSGGNPGDAGADAHDSGANGEGGASSEGGPVDGGVAGEGGDAGDAGPRDIGSCCSAQTTPGCNDPNLEVCVCEKDQTCCTTAWGLQCAYIVQQKYCQPGVRDCVCGDDAGQWDQTSCCSSDWTSTCDTVATEKCSAVTGCF